MLANEMGGAHFEKEDEFPLTTFATSWLKVMINECNTSS